MAPQTLVIYGLWPTLALVATVSRVGGADDRRPLAVLSPMSQGIGLAVSLSKSVPRVLGAVERQSISSSKDYCTSIRPLRGRFETGADADETASRHDDVAPPDQSHYAVSHGESRQRTWHG